ncbi:PilZ domain-containing protein [Motiliproteus sediminis]|uniref:PilZ domain-containing protein n=1 Tax=Motiliproteus sediminis TaxID=1468178 RepID=UPI001AEF91D2|nr:PilZ domain-containing protein [Motiliproteus sediminis]
MSGFKGMPEERTEARYRVDFAAQVRTDWQDSTPAQVTDLSRHGLRVEGARQLVENVFPNFNPPKGTRRPPVDVLFETGQEIGQPAGSVSFSCQTVYVRRVGADRYQIGLQFVEIGEASLALLEQLMLWMEEFGTPADLT